MNILGKFKHFIRNLGLSDEKAWNPSLWNLSRSLSGETVTESTALTYSAVWNAVSLISGTIAALPLHLMQSKGKTHRIIDDRPLYRLMHDNPNPYMTAPAFRECMMAHILTWGNGYAEIVRNGMGEVVELWPITPNRVKVMMQDGKIVFSITRNHESDLILPRDKVLHIPGLGYDGYVGYSVISVMAQKSIGLSMALESFGSLYFGQWTHPGLILSHPGQLSPQARANLTESFIEGTSGLMNSHKVKILEEGMKIEKLGIPPEDSQFLQSRLFQIAEVARWFNLPPHKLKDLSKSSFNNIEQEQISFVQDAILPWLVRLEANYNMQLLTPSERSLSGYGRVYFKHIVEGLLRGDTASRGAFYTVMLDRGVFSINEVRELEDKDPIEGGDIHFVQMNMQNLKDAGKPKPEPEQKLITAPEQNPVPQKGNGKDKEAQQEGRNEAMV